jgi:lysozyme
MSLDQRVIDMIKHHEGVRLKPYQCPALIWTVGVGHVIDQSHIRVPLAERKALPIPDGWNRTLSMGEVDEMLTTDLQSFESGVRRLCPNGLTPGRLGALTSFAFNVGLGNLQRSTIRIKHNRGEYESAADEFLKWNKAGGKELKGLTNRRKDERALYLS